jgi:hypothetical protein
MSDIMTGYQPKKENGELSPTPPHDWSSSVQDDSKYYWNKGFPDYCEHCMYRNTSECKGCEPLNFKYEWHRE